MLEPKPEFQSESNSKPVHCAVFLEACSQQKSFYSCQYCSHLVRGSSWALERQLVWTEIYCKDKTRDFESSRWKQCTIFPHVKMIIFWIYWVKTKCIKINSVDCSLFDVAIRKQLYMCSLPRSHNVSSVTSAFSVRNHYLNLYYEDLLMFFSNNFTI